MPLNPLTGFFARVWKFVDQFQSDDAITRAGLDAALDDFTPSINAALTAKADALRIAGNVGLAFERLTDLQQDLTLTYSTGSQASVAVDDLVLVRDIEVYYEIADPTAIDADVTTPGGVKLYRRNNPTEAAGWAVNETPALLANFNTAHTLKSGVYRFDSTTLNNPFNSKIATLGYNSGYAVILSEVSGNKTIDAIPLNGREQVRRVLQSDGTLNPWNEVVFIHRPTFSALPNNAIVYRNPDGAYALLTPNTGPSGTDQDVLVKNPIGFGMAWRNIGAGIGRDATTPTRAHSTTYQNTTNAHRWVSIRATAASATAVQISADAATWLTVEVIDTVDRCATLLVPPGFSYRVNGTATITSWVEVG